MYPANAWALQGFGSSAQLVSVHLGGEPLAAHGGCVPGEPITASHYGSGFVRASRLRFSITTFGWKNQTIDVYAL